MIQVDGLVKQYGTFKALDGLNMEIDDGQIFGFVGPNGAGKTTAIKIMAGLLSPNSGRVIINGKNVLGNSKALRQEIGYMPDFFGVYDNLKVDEYMDFYAGTYYIPYRERKNLIANLLELVGLTHKTDSYVDVLSRGMKQRLCLARSLVHDPKLLILDEPASGLDPRARVEMKEILKHLKTLNKTIIISSHILAEMTELCSVIGIIDRGRMLMSGSVRDIMRGATGKRKMTIRSLSHFELIGEILSQYPGVSSIVLNVDEILFDFLGDDLELSRIFKDIAGRDIPLISFSENVISLEDVFMNVIGGDNVD